MARAHDVSGRDALLDTAGELFFQQGIGATGVDTIVRHAGVAKMTLYNNFGSKAELVAEYLRMRDRRWWARLGALSEGVEDPIERILVYVDGYRDSAVEDAFRGCPFLNGASEIVDPDHPAYAVTRDHKRAVLEDLTSRVAAAGGTDPRTVAWQLTVVLDGATTQANIVKTEEPFAHARRVVQLVLAAAAAAPTGPQVTSAPRTR